MRGVPCGAVVAVMLAGCGGGAGCDGAREGTERTPEAPQEKVAPAPGSEADPTSARVHDGEGARAGEALDGEVRDPSAAEGDDGHAAQAPPAADAPAEGCVAEGAPVTVWAKGGPATVAAADEGFVVAGYAPDGNGGETLFVARVAKGATAAVPVTRSTVDPPLMKRERQAPPALLVEGGRAWVARVDGAGKLAVAQVAHRQPGAPLRFDAIAEGVDLRFAPALARVGAVTLVAWVDGRGTPMRVRVAKLGRDGKVEARHDVTPDAMGGTAPAFVQGASPPELVFVDARAGMSPLLHVTFDDEGAPGKARVARTVGQVPEPPRVAAARAGDGAWVAYTAVGAAATAAVGWVPLGRAEASPVPLVKGVGYGALAVGAAVTRAGAVVVTEAPLPTEGEAAEAKRRLQVRHVDTGGRLGAPWVLEGSTTTRGEPAVAALPDGTVAVTRRSAQGVRVHLGRCP